MKNNLDEMQEQELLKIEHNGCWLAFWLLLLSLIVQSIVFRELSFKTLAGEWVIFMILSLYLGIACVRKGIWDRKLAMSTRVNLIVSLVAALIVGIFNALIIFKNYRKPVGTLVASVITAVITFVCCFTLLTLMMKYTQKRKTALETEPQDADEL